MSHVDKVYPVAGSYSPSGKPPAGSYYSVKDQPLPPPATYRGTRRRSNCSCLCCLGTLCSIVTAIIVVLGIFALVFWLVVRPQNPKFDVMNVHINNLTNFQSTSSANGNTVSVRPQTTFQVQINNPNKKVGIYYDKIYVDLETLGLDIGEGSLEPFYQGHRNITVRDGNLFPPNGGVLTVSSDSQNNLVNAQKDGILPLEVKVNVRARVKVGSWKSARFTVKVRCSMNVNLNVVTGSQVSGGTHCRVKR